MSKQYFVASFHSEPDLVAGVRAAREHNYRVEDVFTPYPVHGLDEVMGVRPSRLSWACLAFATLGLSFAMWLQHWTSTTDWPLNVGGKPFSSLPAFVPVAFELAVLFAGLGTVAALFARCGLFPGKKPTIPDLRATDDRFVVLVAETDALFDVSAAGELFRQHHAVWCGEMIDGHVYSADPETQSSADGGRDHPDQTDTLGPPGDADLDAHSAAGGHRRRRRTRQVTGAVRE